MTIGRKGRDWMVRHGPPLRAEFTGLGDRPSSNDVAPIASMVIEDFIAGHYDAVYLGTTNFVNTIRQDPVIRQLLPIVPAHPETPMAPDYIFEPSPEAILDELLPGLTELQILQAIYESIASEQSARMVAMRNATDAANDLIGLPDPDLQQGPPGIDHERAAGHRGRGERVDGELSVTGDSGTRN